MKQKKRRHHNNKGLQQTKTGKTHRQVADMAFRLARIKNEIVIKRRNRNEI